MLYWYAHDLNKEIFEEYWQQTLGTQSIENAKDHSQTIEASSRHNNE